MSIKGKSTVFLVLAAMIALGSSRLLADEDHWTGNGNDGLWSNPANWSLNAVPTTNDNAWIDWPGDYQVTLDVAGPNFGMVHDITLGASNGTQTLVISNNFKYTGAFVISSNSVLDIEKGSIAGTNMLMQGLMKWNGGGFDNLQVVNTSPDPTSILWTGMVMTGGRSNLILEAIASNSGALWWNNSASITSRYGGYLKNSGPLFLQTNCNFNGSITLSNTGTVFLPENSGIIQLNFANASPHYAFSFFNSGTFMVGSNSTLEIQSGDYIQFNEGTAFSGPGLTRYLKGNAHVQGMMQVNGTFELAGGYVTQTNIWTGPGILNWSGGGFGFMGNISALNATVSTFAAGLTVNFMGDSPKSIGGYYGATLTNLGTFNWNSTNLSNAPGGQIINNNLLVLNTNCLLPYYISSFINAGTIQVPTGAIVISNSTRFTNSGNIQVGSNAVLNLGNNPGSQGSVTINDGSVFFGTTIFNGGTLVANGGITVNGVFELLGGNLSGTNTWMGAGVFNWKAGQLFYVKTTFAEGFHADLYHGEQYFAGGSIDNYGTLSLDGFLSGAGGSSINAVFNNKGIMLLSNSCYIASNISLNNTGTIVGTTATAALQFSSFTNYGVIQAATNTTVTCFGQNFYCGDGSSFSGLGKLQISYVNAVGIIDVSGTVELGANIYGTNTWVGTGNFSLRNDFTIRPSSQVTFDSSLPKVTAGSISMWSTGVLNNQTTLYGSGAVDLDMGRDGVGGVFNNQGTLVFTNRPSLNMSGGTLNNTGLLVASNGLGVTGANAKINNSGIFLVQNTSGFAGSGTFHNFVGGLFREQGFQPASSWSFVNDGTMEFQPGQFGFTGGYTASGTSVTRIFLGGTTPITEHSQLLSGAVALNGTLVVALTNNFAPVTGMSFALAASNTLTGVFAAAQLPALSDSMAWKLAYTPTALNLLVVPSARMKSAVRSSDGHVQFTVSGAAGAACIVESSTNLVDWSVILSNSPFSGSLDVTNAPALNLKSSFYRARIVQ